MIKEFKGKYRFLSNFYPCLIVDDMTLNYTTLEGAYQAQKSLDLYTRGQISLCNTPSEAKKLGRKIQIRKDWEEIKLSVMKYLLEQKFNKEPFKTLLLETGNEQLVEFNFWHDNFWGSCGCPKHNKSGENNLGKLLMKIRDELRK